MKVRLSCILFTVMLLAGACTPLPEAAFRLATPGAAAPAAVATSARPPSGRPARASAGVFTPRMLTAPGALMGPGPSSFAWSPVGATLAYVEPQNGQAVLWLYDAATGDKKILLDPTKSSDQIDVTSAQWSPQGDVLLLAGEKSLWLLDAKTGALKSLAGGSGSKTGLTFSPSAAHVAFVQDNDLYTIRVSDGQTTRLTTDGSETVFNGNLDWVYNEELATRAAQPAYAWSPDGKRLIYLRLDEADVQNHSVTDFRPVPPTLSYTRYPVAGSPNPKASLHVITLDTGQRAPVPLPADAEYILPFFAWFPDSQEAVYVTVSRGSSALELRAWNPSTGVGRTIIRETDPHWVNENSYTAPIFLGDGGQFLWLSERDGFMHLYLYSRQGELIRQLTQGNWLIDTPAWNLLIPGRPVYVDPAGAWAYFSATKHSPLERQVYRLEIAGGRLEQVSQQPGFHFGALSGDGQYLVDQFSDVATPPVTTILKADGSRVGMLGQSAGPSVALPQLTREFITIKAHDGTDLYAQLVKPANFDPAKGYPVVVHWYGGPTLQLVSNRYGATNIFNIIERDVLYTQAGFIVWRLDNRGAFGRGHAFETPIAGQLGPAALDDQLAGVEYLRSLPYVDASRIGVDGKSFGGYLTLYALIHAPDAFRCGVAGAAPTDWRTYDTIYTERYMRTPEQNPAGYAATNLVDKAGQIRARPLLIHGLADTNVHLQNTVNFIQALEAADKPFDFIPLPNLSHSFRGDGLVAALSASADYLAACLAPAPVVTPETAPSPSGIANPASENCLKQGGTLSIEERGDGGQYGVCLFEDNRQCEEWAMFRGACPVGGIKVTGYVTPAARLCAISGGTYDITGNSGAEDEQGTCTFKNGAKCAAWDYFNGKCDPSAAAAAATVGAAARVPLKDAVAGMAPQDVWQNFYALTQIPRPSHHEEQVRDFLVQFGKGLGLETIVDEAGNVIIRKPAAAGMEDRKGVVLQAHMDMVPQKTPDSTHDFLVDPIEAYVDGEWVVADGTTLGADDGSGIAIAMAVLQTATPLGPVEALFTVDEEDTMSGALGLQPNVLHGDILVNLDWETEGAFAIGSAGGEDAGIETTYPEVAVPPGADLVAYRLSVAGLKGGHSGVDIHLGRGHATKLMVRFLKEASGKYGLRVAQIVGGTADNAIPREASALVVVPKNQSDAFLKGVQEFEGIVKNELAAVEPTLTVQAAPAGVPAKIMDEQAQRTVIDALLATPQGVLRMSDAVPGLVETSTNLGIVKVEDGKLEATHFSRSSVDTELDSVGQMIASVWDLAGFDVTFSGRFSGWRPNPSSPILTLMQVVYQELYGQVPQAIAIHAGLECGTISAKYPGMDAISIGPTLQDVHTPNERLQVASVKKLMDLLLETLQRVPEKHQ